MQWSFLLLLEHMLYDIFFILCLLLFLGPILHEDGIMENMLLMAGVPGNNQIRGFGITRLDESEKRRRTFYVYFYSILLLLLHI